MKAIGLMSGTSADGVDAALVDLCETDRGFEWDLLGYIELSFPETVRQEILSVCEHGRVETICRMDAALGEWFADAALAVCDDSGIDPGEVDVLGSHGQTIHHLPAVAESAGKQVRATLQIGNPAVIAERTGITTVSDFRSRDMAVGGQGAPVVPFVDYLLFRDPQKGRVMLNMGGIANVNILPAGCGVADVFAFDTGPGNMVLDGVVKGVTGGALTFDKHGALASDGKILTDLLAELMRHPFVALAPPKSTGREEFGAEVVDKILAWEGHSKDVVRTTTEWTVACIVEAIDRFVVNRCDAHEVIASGGGTRNPTLMRSLDDALGDISLKTLDEVGMPPEAKEAIAFAILAFQTINGRVGNMPGVTGASKQVVLGSITPG